MSESLIINVPEERTISMVTVEIQTLQKQAQQVVLGYAIEIGKRLTEAKSMYHNVSGGFRGDHNAMTKGAEILQVADRAIAAAYRAKTGKTEKELLQAMDAETWMTAEDAVTMGFIDEIAENKNLKLSASASGSLPSGVVEKVRNLIKAPRIDDAEALKIKYQILNMKMEVMK